MSLSGAMGESDSEVGLAELSALIARLKVGEALTIAELRTEEVTRWNVRTDRCGTPCVSFESIAWTALRHDDAPEDPEFLHFIAPTGEAPLLLAKGEEDSDTPGTNHTLQMALGAFRHARQLAPGTGPSVDDLLREATARVPLSQWYELVLLERALSGRLELTGLQLFEPGTLRDDARTFWVRCEPSGPGGTTFAVVARDGPHVSGLVSMASAKLPPGRYNVTATLRRPGVVRFDGLPTPVHADTRSWTEVRSTVPDRIGDFGPANLIVAVEVSGSEDQVAAHLDRAGQLIGNVARDAEGPVRFSLIAYSAHTHDLRLDDDPVTVLAWADREQAVLAHLPVLRERARTRQDRYTRAASIECMLAETARLLQTRQTRLGQGHPAGRPVLVTVGSRVAFPAYRDPYSEILPCPWRHDWRSFYRWLKEDHPEMAFGSICGGDLDASVWRLLGTDANAELVALDVLQFAAELRLLRPPEEHVPFPMVDL